MRRLALMGLLLLCSCQSLPVASVYNEKDTTIVFEDMMLVFDMPLENGQLYRYKAFKWVYSDDLDKGYTLYYQWQHSPLEWEYMDFEDWDALMAFMWDSISSD